MKYDGPVKDVIWVLFGSESFFDTEQILHIKPSKFSDSCRVVNGIKNQ